MDRLWAPWRLAYVSTAKPTTSADPCFICRGLAENDDRRNLIALRTERTVVFLNQFPYNNGHLLIAPRLHEGGIEHLPIDDLNETLVTLRRLKCTLDKLMSPDGYNVGLNLGLAAGAGLPGHLHWHLVPRWNGDTNFMPIFTDAKVIAQSLEALYDQLTSALAQS